MLDGYVLNTTWKFIENTNMQITYVSDLKIYIAECKVTPVGTYGETPLEALSKLLAIIFH